MITPETDGFKVFAAWNHAGMILPRRARDLAELAKLDDVSDPGASALDRKDGTSRAKSMTAAARQAAAGRRHAGRVPDRRGLEFPRSAHCAEE